MSKAEQENLLNTIRELGEEQLRTALQFMAGWAPKGTLQAVRFAAGDPAVKAVAILARYE